MQSGAGRASTRDQADRIASLMLDHLSIDRANAERILEVPAAAILDAQVAVGGQLVREGSPAFGPVLDELTIPQSPGKAVREGVAAEIPLLIGTNRDEVKLFVGRRDELDQAGLVKAVQASLPRSSESDAAEVVEVYRQSRRTKELPITNLDILDAVHSDVRFRVPSMRLAVNQRQHQPNTYAYLFTYASPARRGALGSCHALELPFVFGTLSAPTQDRFAGSGPDVEQLSRDMMDSWLTFARGSKPAHSGIGDWATYDADTRPTMVFDRVSAPENDPLGDERRAVEALL
jgi:para-nitrobenzyl esterase